MVSPSSVTHVTLVVVPCCQLSYVPYVFKHYDLALKSITLWEAMCITLHSQNPDTTFKIRVSVFAHGSWRAGSLEHRVIPSKLMKRGWKYPLKHQGGDEGTPLKDSKLGALGYFSVLYWVLPNWEPWVIFLCCTECCQIGSPGLSFCAVLSAAKLGALGYFSVLYWVPPYVLILFQWIVTKIQEQMARLKN